MIGKCLVGAAALACVGASAPNATANNGMPPMRFRGNTVAVVVFTDRAGIDEMCGVAPPGYQIIACARSINGSPVIIMPNACPLGDSELYARIMCHEAAHVNGWGPYHEE